MDFRIADTFTDSLGRPTGQEQRAVKTQGAIPPARRGGMKRRSEMAIDDLSRRGFYSRVFTLSPQVALRLVAPMSGTG